MGRTYNKDGTIDLVDDKDASRVLRVAPAKQDIQDAAVKTFFAAEDAAKAAEKAAIDAAVLDAASKIDLPTLVKILVNKGVLEAADLASVP